MCGFAGVLAHDDRSAERLEETARAMAERLAHRGPDDAGTWTAPEAGLGLAFRRLSIIDLSQAGHQPMASGSGRFTVVFNGEIYNHRGLREELRGAGHRFRGSSDTEVLAEALDRWGPEATIPRLRGMFALAAWDASERALWLCRDRLGIKPLYLYDGPDGFAFASELRSFRSYPGFDATLDAEAVAVYLRTLFFPAPLTPFRKVRKLLPGTLVRLRPGDPTLHERRYWSLADRARDGGEGARDPEEAVEELHRVLSEAVRMRMYADVPVGAFLSGGIDSSTVVALMQAQATAPVRTFTIGFDREGFDESSVAREVSDRLGTHHTTIRQDRSALLELIPELDRFVDEPLANPSIIPTYLLSRVTRENVVVALSGDGGDEVFGGYNRYRQGERLLGLARRVPRPLRPGLGRMAGRLPDTVLASALSTVVARQGSLGDQQDWRERWAKVARVVGADDELAMYRALLTVGCERPPVRGVASPGVPPRLPADVAFENGWGDRVDRMMLHDQLEYLPDDLLAKVDRASMAVSLEVRVPILDHHVVEYAWSLPGSLRRGPGPSKWLLREIAARYLPREVLDRPKMGFTVPIAAWLREELEPWVEDTLASASPLDDHLDGAEVRELWRRLARDGEDHLGLGVWALLVLQSWMRSWSHEG